MIIRNGLGENRSDYDARVPRLPGLRRPDESARALRQRRLFMRAVTARLEEHIPGGANNAGGGFQRPRSR